MSNMLRLALIVASMTAPGKKENRVNMWRDVGIYKKNHGDVVSCKVLRYCDWSLISYNPQIKWMCVKNNKLVSNKSA